MCYLSSDGTANCRFNLLACSASLSLLQLSPRLLSLLVVVPPSPSPSVHHSFAYPLLCPSFCFNYSSTEDTQHKRQAQLHDSPLCLPLGLPVSLSLCLPVSLSVLIALLYINTAQRNALPSRPAPPLSLSLSLSSLLCSAPFR